MFSVDNPDKTSQLILLVLPFDAFDAWGRSLNLLLQIPTRFSAGILGKTDRFSMVSTDPFFSRGST